MHDDVRPVFERPAQVRRGHRVVDDQRHAMPLGHRRPGGQIDHVAGRIADRLAKERAGVVVDGCLQPGQVIMGHEAARHALIGQRMRKQVVGTPIELAGRDDVAAR